VSVEIQSLRQRLLLIASVVATTAKLTLYPLQSCIKFPRWDSYWLQNLSVDALYLHSYVFVTQVYSDLLHGRSLRLGEKASPNFMKTLRFLRERLLLASENAQVSDNTITTVVCLFYHAHIRGEYDTAQQHLRGIYRMVSIRGGLESVWENEKIFMEVLR
jgi:hypothetical protein